MTIPVSSGVVFASRFSVVVANWRSRVDSAAGAARLARKGRHKRQMIFLAQHRLDWPLGRQRGQGDRACNFA